MSPAAFGSRLYIPARARRRTGQDVTVAAVKLLDQGDVVPGGSTCMILVMEEWPPHPFDWWPETSFRRAFDPVES